MTTDTRVKNCKLLVYPEFFDVVLTALQGTYEYCYIFHDKDNSKPHYHFLIVFPSQRRLYSVAEEIGIDRRFVRNCPDVGIFFQYMTHYEKLGKFHYSVDDIKGEKSLIDRLSSDKFFDANFKNFYELVKSQKGYPSYIKLYDEVLKANKLKEFSKYLPLLKPIITELQQQYISTHNILNGGK